MNVRRLSAAEVLNRLDHAESYTPDERLDAIEAAMRTGCKDLRSLHGDEVFRCALKLFARAAGLSEEDLAETVDPIAVGVLQIVACEAAAANLRHCADALGLSPGDLLQTCKRHVAAAGSRSH